ncbi:universal stress protein [Roseateles saccharophilus]|uniref:Nucleotide-binding universal stress UspA family protein n=1 Tax=Roseateles saccharophilus TaxID=304 RepID=A0A4R3UJM3_ROSSA|nr:universal stress protein [Roseateles saccharophilus]MDG0836100.1 universal stress protein [Roseateles saccharophilus]TCU90661.1 nucleotide-binding universal stress UspA family protein [Roseateles saccharophilus]
MTYRSMLVALDALPANPARINIAIALARQFEAHLIGLAPIPTLDLQTLQAAAMDDYVARASATMQAQAHDIAQHFHARCEAAALPSFEALVDKAPVAESLTSRAQCTDLLVMSQPDPSLPGHKQQLAELEEVLLDCSRPVLLVPYTHLEPLRLRRVLLAWDGSRESVRAMTDALPLLRRAEAVTLMHWRGEADDQRPLERLAGLRQWLAFQGVDAEVRDEVTPLSVGDALLNAASDHGADLIVMGAYGHARWTERLFGGVSRTLLQSMTVPVLMSH